MLRLNNPEAYQIIEAFCDEDLKRWQAIRALRHLGCPWYYALQLTGDIIVYRRGAALGPEKGN